MNNDDNNDNSYDEIGGITFTDYEPIVSEENVDGDFVDEEYYKRGGKKKKKRKKKRYFLKFLIFLLVLVAIFLFLRSDFFNVDKINIKDNSHYTEEQIVKLSGVKVGDNLFSFMTSRVEKKLAKDPYIETAEIKRMLPDGLVITVKERAEQIVIPYNNQFVIADYSGMVLRMATEAPDLTVINNVTVKDPKPGEALEVKETQILTDTLNLLKLVEKEGLYFTKISVSQYSVRANIYDHLVVEGTYDNIKDNITYLIQVIEDQHKKKVTRGTIKVSGNGYCVFQPEVENKDS